MVATIFGLKSVTLSQTCFARPPSFTAIFVDNLGDCSKQVLLYINNVKRHFKMTPQIVKYHFLGKDTLLTLFGLYLKHFVRTEIPALLIF